MHYAKEITITLIFCHSIFLPFLGHCELPKDASKTTTTTIPEPEDPSPKNLRDQISGQAIKSGIVRIWQSWRSSDKTDGPSFTLKRGVSIQPIEVRGGRDTLIEGKHWGRGINDNLVSVLFHIKKYTILILTW